MDPEPSRFFVEAAGARLAVRDFGGAGEVVLFLHGGPGCPDYLFPVAQLLSPRYRCITFDQRGVGASTARRRRFELDDYVADIEAIRTHIGSDDMHIFGHSWGGLLGQVYLSRHAERLRSLFLSSPAPGLGEQWKTAGAEIMRFHRRRSPSRFARMGFWQALMPLPSPVGDAAAGRLMGLVWRNNFPRGTASPPDRNWIRGVRSEAMRRTGTAARSASSDQLDGWAAQGDTAIMVLFGGHDIYETAPETLRVRFPAARHVLLEKSGHFPWIQDPHGFRALLADFYQL